MKWTDQLTKELKSLCNDNVPNKEIAEFFGVPITEIYAKRSQLGITIPKIRAAQGRQGRPGLTVNPELEAAVQEMEMGMKPQMPKAIKKAFDDLGTAIVLKMAGNHTTILEAKVYCSMAEELIDMKARYKKLLEAIS